MFESSSLREDEFLLAEGGGKGTHPLPAFFFTFSFADERKCVDEGSRTKTVRKLTMVRRSLSFLKIKEVQMKLCGGFDLRMA
jgi:hypothetical protein